uniref:Uncharacterized protein n=1 Tax=viral metagenome TaxID=1070528 RepID=A0A6C0BMN4_9ZZZZ
MEEDLSQGNRYTTPIAPPHETLGVENELRRFAMNEYLETRKKQILVGTNEGVVDDDTPTDDLLLTNAVTENVAQDEIDKTRYLKETKSYINICSSARKMSAPEIDGGTNSLFTTGSDYYPIYPFAPYTLVTDSNGNPLEIDDNYFVNMSANINHIQFRLQDITFETEPVQVLTPGYSEIFDVFLPASGTNLTLDQLQSIMTTNLNLVASTGNPLNHSPDRYHMFTVEIVRHPTVNPDRASITVQCQGHFQFTMTFFSYGDLESTLIAKPIPASDAAYTIQNPISVFPYPNSYAINLDKAYSVVKAIRVITSEIPNSDTIINSYNNHFSFRLINKTFPPPTEDNPYSQNLRTSDGSLDWNLYIPYGNYTLAQLVAQMELLINNMLYGEAHVSNVFTITGDQTTNVFEIAVSTPYAFKWNFWANSAISWKNLYQMLGYQNPTTPSYVTKFTNLINTLVETQTISNPYKPIILRKSKTVWLQLNNYETIYDTGTQIKYFCKFSLDKTKDGDFAHDTYTPNVHVFVDGPIPVLQTIDVRMYDELGMPYNFNDIDHQFTLEIIHHVDRLMGNDYNSRRGVNDKSSYI